MDPEFFALPQDLNVDEAIYQIRTRAPRDLHEIYIIDRNQVLTGILLLRDLFLAPQHETPTIFDESRLANHSSRLKAKNKSSRSSINGRVLTIPVTDLNWPLTGGYPKSGYHRSRKGRSHNRHANHGRSEQRRTGSLTLLCLPCESACLGSKLTCLLRFWRRSSSVYLRTPSPNLRPWPSCFPS